MMRTGSDRGLYTLISNRAFYQPEASAISIRGPGHTVTCDFAYKISDTHHQMYPTVQSKVNPTGNFRRFRIRFPRIYFNEVG